jgi:hypothetical protein
MIVALVVVFEILGVLSAVVSVPAYRVFGRNKFRGYVLARQHELELIDDIVRQANGAVPGSVPICRLCR